ncbi:(2Fe-2S)-binding protein [Aeromicrobium sp. CTD01-1L150]|uniref:(2Fe-2S)-binding protein n=1 Tax=Aeromicrobium sp. CTD01-1L150 TaxID=3341830 RepID=UPI0035C21165
MDDDRARRDVAALGDFFALEEADAGGDWRPVTDLLTGPELGERVAVTGAALARSCGSDVEPRVAASTTSLGLFARLLSPAIGAAVLDLPGPMHNGLQWRVAQAGPVPLRTAVWGAGSLEAMVSGVVEPLAARFTDEHALAEAIVRGNTASAVMGSVRMVVSARADLAPAAERVASSLLDSAFLAGTALPGAPFVRRSCCLYYRLPGGGYCGDCVLAPQHRERVAADQRS